MKSAVRAFALALLAAWLFPAAAANLDEALILVARPEVGDQVFAHTVLIVVPAGHGQHAGFIVNRPSSVSLGKVFPGYAPSQKLVDPIYMGGPVEPGLVFALVQRQASPGGNSFEAMPGLYVAYESAVLDRIIKSDPQHARFVAGMVTWRSGELQSEIDLGAWIVLEADAELIMRKADGLWDELVRRWQQRSNSI
jgi:putative transcriptional regulator